MDPNQPYNGLIGNEMLYRPHQPWHPQQAQPPVQPAQLPGQPGVFPPQHPVQHQFPAQPQLGAAYQVQLQLQQQLAQQGALILQQQQQLAQQGARIAILDGEINRHRQEVQDALVNTGRERHVAMDLSSRLRLSRRTITELQAQIESAQATNVPDTATNVPDQKVIANFAVPSARRVAQSPSLLVAH